MLIDFPDGALVPIWLLCTDKARQQELGNGFKAYAKTCGKVAMSADMIPIYLLRAVDPPTTPYQRLTTGCRTSTRLRKRGTWSAVTKDPWLCLFAENKPGTVPLYE